MTPNVTKTWTHFKPPVISAVVLMPDEAENPVPKNLYYGNVIGMNSLTV
jgi:hypothetical protein